MGALGPTAIALTLALASLGCGDGAPTPDPVVAPEDASELESATGAANGGRFACARHPDGKLWDCRVTRDGRETRCRDLDGDAVDRVTALARCPE